MSESSLESLKQAVSDLNKAPIPQPRNKRAAFEVISPDQRETKRRTMAPIPILSKAPEVDASEGSYSQVVKTRKAIIWDKSGQPFTQAKGAELEEILSYQLQIRNKRNPNDRMVFSGCFVGRERLVILYQEDRLFEWLLDVVGNLSVSWEGAEICVNKEEEMRKLVTVFGHFPGNMVSVEKALENLSDNNPGLMVGSWQVAYAYLCDDGQGVRMKIYVPAEAFVALKNTYKMNPAYKMTVAYFSTRDQNRASHN